MDTAEILKMLEHPEWHEESVSYTQYETDLRHDPMYCWGCQLIGLINGSEQPKKLEMIARDWYAEGLKVAAQNAQQNSLKILESYFDLTRYSEEVEGAEPNPEWDRGYQAAMAILRTNDK
jgi:hypothetical protein